MSAGISWCIKLNRRKITIFYIYVYIGEKIIRKLKGKSDQKGKLKEKLLNIY